MSILWCSFFTQFLCMSIMRFSLRSSYARWAQSIHLKLNYTHRRTTIRCCYVLQNYVRDEKRVMDELMRFSRGNSSELNAQMLLIAIPKLMQPQMCLPIHIEWGNFFASNFFHSILCSCHAWVFPFYTVSENIFLCVFFFHFRKYAQVRLNHLLRHQVRKVWNLKEINKRNLQLRQESDTHIQDTERKAEHKQTTI